MGFCQMHFMRWYRYGHPLTTEKLPVTGRTKHPLYGTYQNMKNRCFVVTNKGYKDYGGRGITICDEWLGVGGFEQFVKDMGDKPSPKHSIERIDHDGNYEPNNCRWATSHEQNGNTRRSGKIVGVSRSSCGRYWVAKLTVNGKNVLLKTTKNKHLAIKLRQEAEKLYL